LKEKCLTEEKGRDKNTWERSHITNEKETNLKFSSPNPKHIIPNPSPSPLPSPSKYTSTISAALSHSSIFSNSNFRDGLDPPGRMIRIETVHLRFGDVFVDDLAYE
jgi:hypothetical protein